MGDNYNLEVSLLNDTVRIYNFKQACAYIKCGIKPIDIEYGKKGDLIFTFDKEETKPIWELWKHHKIDLSAPGGQQ